MRPFLLAAATLFAVTAAPCTCQSQVYYAGTPYTVSYAPDYWTYSPVIVEQPIYSTTYYVARHHVAVSNSACDCSSTNAPSTFNKPAVNTPSTVNKPVDPEQPHYEPTTTVYMPRKYNVFSNGSQIYAADSSGQLWRLDVSDWIEVSGPVPSK